MTSLPTLKGLDPAGRPTVAVTLRLFATLARWLPDGARRNEIRLALPAGTTPAAMIATLDLPVALCALVLIDGVFVLPEERPTRALRDGETLAIWPPVAGG